MPNQFDTALCGSNVIFQCFLYNMRRKFIVSIKTIFTGEEIKMKPKGRLNFMILRLMLPQPFFAFGPLSLTSTLQLQNPT